MNNTWLQISFNLHGYQLYFVISRPVKISFLQMSSVTNPQPLKKKMFYSQIFSIWIMKTLVQWNLYGLFYILFSLAGFEMIFKARALSKC